VITIFRLIVAFFASIGRLLVGALQGVGRVAIFGATTVSRASRDLARDRYGRLDASTPRSRATCSTVVSC